MDITLAGEIATLAIDNRRTSLADNIKNHNPVTRQIQEVADDGTAGGIYLTEAITYDENHTFQYYHGMQPFDLSRNEKFKTAFYPWREWIIAVAMAQRDLNIVTSKAKFIDLFDAEMSVAEDTIDNQVAWSVMGNGMNYNGLDITGIQAMITNSGTGTVGRINGDVDTWWRNKVYDMSLNGQRLSVNGLVTATNWMCTALRRNKEYPNIAMCSRKVFDIYQQTQQAHYMHSDTDEGEMGFETIKWRGLNLYFDDACPEDNLYFLNTKYLKYRPHTDVNMKRLETRTPLNQNAFVELIAWMGNMTLSNRFMQGVIVGNA